MSDNDLSDTEIATRQIGEVRADGTSRPSALALAETVERMLVKARTHSCGPVNDFGSGTLADNHPTTGAVYDGAGHGVREAPMPRPR